jgi:uncharacterized membrane protein
MTDAGETSAATQPTVNDRGFALAVYILYIAGFFTGITALIGAIIAYVKAPTATPDLKKLSFNSKCELFGSAFSICVLAGCCSMWR